MRRINRSGWIVAVAVLLQLAMGGVVFAQLQTGNLWGTVIDTQGTRLPGVTVTLTGQGVPQVFVTDVQGEFRVLNLPPGTYQIKAELSGFSTAEYPNIVITVGRNTFIEVKLAPAMEQRPK